LNKKEMASGYVKGERAEAVEEDPFLLESVLDTMNMDSLIWRTWSCGLHCRLVCIASKGQVSELAVVERQLDLVCSCRRQSQVE
jgi:hypothetical protein